MELPPGFREAYGHFLRPDRILLSGHSHQAWPDVAREAQLRAFDDAARWVDDKWGPTFEVLASVGRRINARTGFSEGDPIAFGESSHQLVYRLLSCFPLAQRPKVVTSTAEFHSLYRQLSRMQEEGLEVVWVDAQPREGLVDRVIEAAGEGTTLVALSAVLFEDAWVVPGIDRLISHCVSIGAVPLIDAYHAFNCVPIDWGPDRDAAFVTAGGYKYAGFGNGICWLRFPPSCTLRPVYTGWFSDFAHLADPRDTSAPVAYGPGGFRFAGSTFDASAAYRADAVLDHWDRFGFDLERLAATYRAQTGRIIERLDEAPGTFELLSPRAAEQRGPFVTVRHRQAGAVVERLRERGVFVDARADRLRLGPAPYLTDDEIDRGVSAAIEVARSL